MERGGRGRISPEEAFEDHERAIPVGIRWCRVLIREKTINSKGKERRWNLNFPRE